MREQSFVMLKPDAVKRRLAGEVLSRFEKRGLKIVAAKMMVISPELAKSTMQNTVKNPSSKIWLVT